MATNHVVAIIRGGEVISLIGLISLIGPIDLISQIALNQSCNNILTATWQHVNDRNLRHCVASRSKAHTCTGHVNKHLCSKSRVINRHIEREMLVVGLTTNTLTSHVNAMTNIIQSSHTWYGKDVQLVVSKVIVSLKILVTSSRLAPSSNST